MRLHRLALFVAAALLTVAGVARADVTATAERLTFDDATPAFKFPSVPAPSKDDLATDATFTLIAGETDPNSPGLEVLHDGKAATSSDDPAASFFLAEPTVGGRLKVDLGAVKDVGQINTYSWHTDTRAPQVYKVYASDGGSQDFDADPKMYLDPAQAGWTLLASVDTRPEGGPEGGQYGVSLNDRDAGSLGKFRYVLLDLSRTEGEDPFGNTFFSEVDVVAKDKTQMLATVAKNAGRDDGTFKVTVDTAGLSPDMAKWAREKLEPVCKAWYPKIVKLLPSEGYTAPRSFTVAFRSDMGGTPAYTAGNRISCNIGWFEKNRDGEAVGSVVHEMVHVVQQYKFGRKNVPFWLQEGIPDYIRWYLYQPQDHGTRIRDVSKAKYDGAYRISANFLNWASETYDKTLVTKVNAIIRQGKYTDDVWQKLTGKTIDQLNDEWKASLEKKNE